MNYKLYSILFVGLLARLIWTFVPWESLQVLLYDDAFYYFAIAKTLAATGKVSADGITLTNGFHPLWLLAILPVYLFKLFNLVLSLRVILLIAITFDTIAAYFIFKILKDQSEKVALIGAGFYFLNPIVLVQSMSGMETPLVAMMITLWIYQI